MLFSNIHYSNDLTAPRLLSIPHRSHAVAYNNDNAQAFRTRYRDAIHPLYTPWLHAGFVLAYGLTCISLL